MRFQSNPVYLYQLDARHFYPVTVALPERVGRTSKGKRVTPTGGCSDFGVDNRMPYFPSSYPGTVSVGWSPILVHQSVPHCAPRRPGQFSVHDKVRTRLLQQTVYTPSFFSWVKTVTYYEGSDLGWDFALLRLYQPLGDHHIGFFGVRTYNDDWNDLSIWAAVGHPSMAPSAMRYRHA